MWTYLQYLQNVLKELIVEYIDIDFTLWTSWLLAPLIISFLLPLIIVVLIYISMLMFYIYKIHWPLLRSVYDSNSRLDTARNTVAAIWDAHSWIWHGFEVEGIENIPNNGPALIIFYHGAIPIDIYYIIAKVLLQKNRMITSVGDYFLFKIPGFKILIDSLNVIPGTVQTCSNVLKEGDLLAISPGGVYESQFSCNYNLMWKKRLGFAKVALEAKVPIIPVFTENVREAFRTISIGRKFFLKLYAKTKFPFVPIYGGFPVKMIAHVGKPIPYDPNLTPEELQYKVHQAITDLISEHQRMPGNILHALLDRIPYVQGRHKKTL